ncbi:hypothetical protein FQ192_04390 [Pseudomonas sp. ANT_J12]|nr:hypothetical protein FQ192_04390 [Pseudomonas sp. ANT_J12]
MNTLFLAHPHLWRGGLPPLGCAAAPKPANAFFQAHRIYRFYDGYAAERGQAPSPQVLVVPQVFV